MKICVVAAFALIQFACLVPCYGGGKTVHVKGHYRSDGRYVAPYTRSAPSHSSGSFSVPSLSAPTVPHDVSVEGYYKKDGTYVPPHRRHIDGIKNSESSGRGSTDALAVGGSRGTAGRSSYRTSARSSPRRTTPSGQSISRMAKYPVRTWRSSDGSVIAVGRMRYRAGKKLHVQLADETETDLNIDDLCEDDLQWLEAARQNPKKFKEVPTLADTDQPPVEIEEAQVQLQ